MNVNVRDGVVVVEFPVSELGEVASAGLRGMRADRGGEHGKYAYRTSSGKYQSQVSVKGKRVSLGSYETAEEATQVGEAFLKLLGRVVASGEEWSEHVKRCIIECQT